VKGDPNYLYECGVRVFQCGSLEQCEERCGDGGTSEAGTTGDGGDASGGNCTAACVNPCLDTLGQNTSNGCEFYPVEMDVPDMAAGVCYAVFLVNEWHTGEPAKIEVDQGGGTLPVEQFTRLPNGTGQNITYAPYVASLGLPQNNVAVMFLSRDPNRLPDQGPSDPATLANCPEGIVPAIVGDAATHGTGVGTAFHVRTNVPVVAYQMLPFGGGSARVTGATLLLPTNVWGTNYLAVNAYPQSPTLLPYANSGPTMVIIASANDTHVTINPVTNILAGSLIAASPAGQAVTFPLDQGQYLQFTQPLELSGSAIQADKPIGVIGGTGVMDIPVSQQQRADHGEQMVPPVQALGNQYVGVRYRTRSPPVEESVPWRIFGAVNGTTLTYDPPQPGAPATLAAHQVVQFDATGPFIVSSQDAEHPFYFAQYMTGGEPFSGMGDPEFVNVVAPAQYLSSYVFFTDPTYPETNLVVTRELDGSSGQFPDVTLDCAGLLTGWQPVGASGLYQFTRIDLSTDNFEGQNGCNNGVHTMTGSFPSEAGSSSPLFGVTVWGWGNPLTSSLPDDAQDPVQEGITESQPGFTRWVSYGYPAGANITKLNNVVLSTQ